MSEINHLSAEIKLSTDFQINKKILKEKIQTDLHLTHNDGMFKITPELLAFVQTWPSNELYLEDIYENPVEINRETFLTAAQQHYQTLMNRWHQAHAELKKIRKI
jgi:hypothetical protein